MTLAVKSHGFTTGNFSLKAVSTTTSDVERRQQNHIKELNSTAIVLIRNPFRAIIGHRHLDEGGHTGHAKEESFLGPGKLEPRSAFLPDKKRLALMLNKMSRVTAMFLFLFWSHSSGNNLKWRFQEL